MAEDYMVSAQITGVTAVGSVDTINGTRDWYNFERAAEYCGINPTTLRNRHRTGTGPSFFKPSRKSVLFTQQALDEWLAGWQKYERT